MLTRLEVDGFKNLLGLAIDFGPFTCIAGVNSTGKSNVFDAIQFLSLLADRQLVEAAQEVRDVHGERTGDVRDLFWSGDFAKEPRIRFAAEMIVPGQVEDDFGRQAEATHTFLRYELHIGYQSPVGREKLGRLVLLKEELRHINISNSAQRLRFPHNAGEFRKTVLYGKRTAPYISTEQSNGQAIVAVHQDGGSRGKPKRSPAERAPATIVSTVTSSDDPTILAARREMQSWRRLALEPSSLRTADRFVDPHVMDVNGRHLAATLDRVANRQGAEPSAVYARITNRLADLTGLDVRDLYVHADDARELLTVKLVESSGITLSARSLSEGTLRFLALCVLLEDPSVTGLVCMEEPENGIHPANIPAMIELVQDLAVDPSMAPNDDNPFRQVIINTHSPLVVQLVPPECQLFADTALVKGPTGAPVHALRLRPMEKTWRAGSSDAAVSLLDIYPYLSKPVGAQLTLGDIA
jgi:predicted ATPase